MDLNFSRIDPKTLSHRWERIAQKCGTILKRVNRLDRWIQWAPSQTCSGCKNCPDSVNPKHRLQYWRHLLKETIQYEKATRYTARQRSLYMGQIATARRRWWAAAKWSQIHVWGRDVTDDGFHPFGFEMECRKYLEPLVWWTSCAEIEEANNKKYQK